MDKDLFQQQPQPQMMNSGLTRYRSAPSSYFSNLISSGLYGDDDTDPFFNTRVSSPEAERIISRFMSSGAGDIGGGGGGGDNLSSHQNLAQIAPNDSQFLESVKQEQGGIFSQSQQHQQMGYRNQSQSQTQPQQPAHENQVLASSTSAMDDPLMAMNPPTNLLRQSSSPAGFLSHLNIENGFSAMRPMENFGAGRGSLPDSSFSSAKRMKSQMGFSSVPPSSAGMLSRIPENESKIMGIGGAPEDGSFGETWDESAILNDSFLKELGESDRNTFPSLNSADNNQNDEGRIRPSSLAHHLSLPTSSSELSAMEKLLQFPDSVPLRSRAKRGCATHPRSIAERVRRTRISERMRKLQELVPNMEKQTNTADMLDLAVDYIKELQKQVETLSDHHKKCTCPHKQKL